MVVTQIYDIVSGALKQAFGEESINATDLTDLVSEGNSLISGADGTQFDVLKLGLLDRVRKLVLGNRRYTRDKLNILRDVADYGSLVEKIYYEPIDPQENATWLLANGKSVDPFVVSMSGIAVKYFSNIVSWEIPYTIYDRQIKSAFTSETEMSAFISGLVQIAQNSFEAQVEVTESWTMANFIGEKIAYSKEDGAKGIQVINLLSEYNAIKGASLTAIECRTNPDFLKYACARIGIIYDSLDRYSTLFNTEQYKRFTPQDSRRLTMFTQFEKYMTSYLTSDTYNKDLVSLPEHRSLPYWQGTGESLSFEDCSSINIITSSGKTIAQTGIVGFIHDYEALGLTVYNERITNQYNGHGEYNNYWIKADVGLFNDLSENAVVFVIDDGSIPVTLDVDTTSVDRNLVNNPS